MFKSWNKSNCRTRKSKNNVIFLNIVLYCLFLTVGVKLILNVSDSQGLLVLYPDTLVSPTRVADACSCERRSVISDRTNSPGVVGYSPAATLGNLKHECIEVIVRR